MTASIATLVIVLFASITFVIAFHVRAVTPARLLGAVLSGMIVAIVLWLISAQAGGFPVVAGLIVSLAFMVLLAFSGERRENHIDQPLEH